MSDLETYLKKQIATIKKEVDLKCSELLINQEKYNKIKEEKDLYEKVFVDWKTYYEIENESFKEDNINSFEFIEKLEKQEKLLKKTIDLQKLNIDTMIKQIVDLKVNLNWIKDTDYED